MIDSNMPKTVMSWPRIKTAGIAPVKKVHTCTTQFIIIRSPSRDAVPHLHVWNQCFYIKSDLQASY